MILGIDACNIRNGGGLEHLKQIVENCNFEKHQISKIVIWSNNYTLSYFPSNDKILKKTHFLLNSNFFGPFVFQIFFLKKFLIAESCDILLVPGGIFLARFKPFVTISQNMLPFNLEEAYRYSKFSQKFRFIFIRFLQSYTFRKADGLIFLSHYAKNTIGKLLRLNNNYPVIPHGFKSTLCISDRKIKSTKMLNLLYVSAISPYKHQWNVAEAVCLLYLEGFDIKLTLVGPYEEYSFKKLLNVLKKFPCSEKCIELAGYIPHDKINKFYINADAFIFASTCENNPIILSEAISAGLPILSSFYPPMSELLTRNEAVFFDPLNVQSIKNAISIGLKDFSQLHKKSIEAKKKQLNHPNWQITADITFKYLNDCLNINK